MKTILIATGLLLVVNANAQSRIVINNDANIVLSNSVYVVIDNNNTNAISTLGTGGNIISESENNIIKWNIGTNSGNFVVPFTSASGNKIPVNLNVTIGGTGSGAILFSTYPGANWDNDTYKPIGVLNMTNMGFTNNSGEVIDRFWMLDATGYSNKPSGDILFTYIDAEYLAPGNTITEADLKAERYDEATDDWELFPVGGVVNTANNEVSGVPFNNTDFTRVWTLLDQTTHTLPLVLTGFDAVCGNDETIISWETAQEQNTAYFILSASTDGLHFNDVATINAIGNSNESQQYEFIADAHAGDYYKLRLVNYDLSTNELGVVYTACAFNSEGSAFAFISGLKEITLQTDNLTAGNYNLNLFDLSGRVVYSNTIAIDDNFNSFVINENKIASGMYILRLNAVAPNSDYTYTIHLPYLH